MKIRNNSAVKAEIVEAIELGLDREGFKQTPHNIRLTRWAQTHECKFVRAKGGEEHAGHVVAIKTTYGQLVGEYEW